MIIPLKRIRFRGLLLRTFKLKAGIFKLKVRKTRFEAKLLFLNLIINILIIYITYKRLIKSAYKANEPKLPKPVINGHNDISNRPKLNLLKNLTVPLRP